MSVMIVSISDTDISGGTNLDISTISFCSFSARSGLFAEVNIWAASFYCSVSVSSLVDSRLENIAHAALNCCSDDANLEDGIKAQNQYKIPLHRKYTHQIRR